MRVAIKKTKLSNDMKTTLEALDTIAVKHGYQDWIHAGFLKEAAELTTLVTEAMEYYAELSNSHKHGVVRPVLAGVSDGELLPTEAQGTGRVRGYPCYETPNCHVYSPVGICPTCGGYTRGKPSVAAAP